MEHDQFEEEKLSRELYGRNLAEKIIRKLIKQLEGRTPPAGIYRSHRDYCGIGIFYDGSSFSIQYVYESWPEKSIVSFRNEDEIISFLAEHSDYSMSGYDKKSVMKESDAFKLNNQRITRKFLLNFLSTQK